MNIKSIFAMAFMATALVGTTFTLASCEDDEKPETIQGVAVETYRTRRSDDVTPHRESHRRKSQCSFPRIQGYSENRRYNQERQAQPHHHLPSHWYAHGRDLHLHWSKIS